MTKRKGLKKTSELDERVDDILAIVNALQLAGQVNTFRNWLRNYHRIRCDRDYFEGYKFVFNVLTRLLYEELAINLSLGLSEDLIFTRASFAGVSLSKISNSCDKTILLKNIHRESRAVLRSSDWTQLETTLKQFENDILSPLIQLKSISVANPRYKFISLDEAVNCATMFEIYISLNDTSYGVPHGYTQSMFDNSVFEPLPTRNNKYLGMVFEGYKYTVQFLWFLLINADFGTSSLVEIHKADGWNSFDTYFEIVRKEIIEPREIKSQTLWGLAPLITLRSNPKSLLKALLKQKPPEPELGEREQLEQIFLWYPIELVDASQGTLFNGVPAFISALSGSIEIKKKLGNPDKIQVVKLVHPANQRENDFSYGVLMEVTGLFSDSSGWILFFDCCYDTGSGIQRLQFAEQFITEYLRKGLIEVQVKNITKGDFLSSMKERLISTTKEEMVKVQETNEQHRNMSGKFDTSRGLLLELLAYYYYSSLVDIGTRIEWNYMHLNQQIDILLKSRDLVSFVECTNCDYSLIDDAKRLQEKADKLWNDPKFRRDWRIDDNLSREYVVFVWDRPSPNMINEIRQRGVKVTILSEEMNVHQKLVRKSKDKIRHIFSKVNANPPNINPDEFKGALFAKPDRQD